MKHSPFILIIFLLILAGACSVFNEEGECKGESCGGVDTPMPVYPQAYTEPSVSPDGSKLLFVRNKITHISKVGFFSIDTDSSGIWMADIDGSNMKLLIQSQNIGTPSFSPDMEWVLFEAGGQIFKIPFDRDSVIMAGLVQLTSEGRNISPDWSPDGQWIAYSNTVCGSINESPPFNACGIIIQDLKDGTKKLVKKYSQMPIWKSNNIEITFVNRAVHKSGEVVGDSIWTYQLKDSTSKFLAFIHGDNRYLKYSPDDKKITFESNGQIWSMKSDGKNPIQLYKDGKMPVWYSNEKIIFIDFNPHRFTKDNGTIWIINLDGSNRRQLTQNYGLVMSD